MVRTLDVVSLCASSLLNPEGLRQREGGRERGRAEGEGRRESRGRRGEAGRLTSHDGPRPAVEIGLPYLRSTKKYAGAGRATNLPEIKNAGDGSAGSAKKYAGMPKILTS